MIHFNVLYDMNDTGEEVPARDWRIVLSEIRSDEDLLTNQGQEIYNMSRDSLPPEIQRWRAALGLCLWLGNGWGDVAYQHVDDLSLGVAGFEDCGFELGATSGRDVIQAFVNHGLDPSAPDFEEQYQIAEEDVVEGIEQAIQEIDDKVESDLWDAFDHLHDLMILRAKQLSQ